MQNQRKLRIILFALPGFGNPVLASLMKDDRVDVVAVFTVKYKTPFPYYKEKQLNVVCEDYGIPCYYGIKVTSVEGLNLIHSLSPDLILVATFKQILKQNVLDIPQLGVVNFHPSLLPKYRGPCPTNAALFHGEKYTGVTAHFVTSGIDDGDILLQKIVTIEETWVDSELRHKLADLSGDMVPDLIDLFINFERPSGKPQDHEKASSAPKPIVEAGYLESAPDIEMIQRQIRAFNPIPGTSVLVGERRIFVDRFERVSIDQDDGVFECQDYIDLVIRSEAIRLFKREF